MCHSGFETGSFEGPYTPATAEVGVNRLIASLERAGIGPNENVYFTISDEFQERYGYPALTKELQAKVLGRNAARLYGIEPEPPRCDFTRRELAKIRQELRDGDRLLGPATLAGSMDVREHHRLEVATVA